jgi:hypothetical protein
MSRINPTASAKLNGGSLIAMRFLAEKLHLDPRMVLGWSRRRGVLGHRLTTISLGGWRYTTIEVFNQFVADVNGWSESTETGPWLGFYLGILPFINEGWDCPSCRHELDKRQGTTAPSL